LNAALWTFFDLKKAVKHASGKAEKETFSSDVAAGTEKKK
jgi:hypothetical protein